MTTKIHRISDTAFALQIGQTAYSLSTSVRTTGDTTIFNIVRNPNWEYAYQNVMGKRIVPYGPGNDMPVMVRDLVQDNNLAPGILQRQKGLLYGQGAFLYRYVFRKGKIAREYDDDPEISAWLASWQAKKFIEKALVDHLHMQGFFALHFMERAQRLGARAVDHLGRKARIAKLQFVKSTNARLEWTDTRCLEDVKHIFVGDFENGCLTSGIQTFPVYDPLDPGKYPVSASYNYSYSFGRNFYSTPAFLGAIRWILRGSDIPMIFKYVTDNGLNLAYHIHSPAGYWEKKKQKLEELYPQDQPAEIETRLEKVKAEILDTITEVLSGKKNAGKFFESIDFYDADHNLCSWKIEAVDQKIKDFVESQLKIGDAANSAITSGMQLHPSLTNIMVNGKLASGSEMLYAHQIYKLSDVAIPEMVILDPINQAIKFNFPDTDLQLGFYHQNLMAEEQVAPEDRTRNN